MKADDPHDVCTWRDEKVCVDCGLRGELNCRWDSKVLRFFVLKEIPPIVVAIFGMVMVGIMSGLWWPLAALFIMVIVFWGFGLETRILCSHCPYYAEEGKTLHCLALHGSPKWWRYRPEPMNRLEKTVLLFFFISLLVIPVLVEAYGIWFITTHYGEYGLIALLGMVGITLASIMAGILWVLIMLYAFCSQCVNFSCPLNTVPKSMVDEYLRRNPVMRDAWVKSGYRLD
jgi:hypothetical protein